MTNVELPLVLHLVDPDVDVDVDGADRRRSVLRSFVKAAKHVGRLSDPG